MPLEHRLDPGRACTALDAGDLAAAADEDEGRRLLDAELVRDVAPLVEVDLHDAQTMPLLAGDMREQAFHPTRRARARGGEEQQGAKVGVQLLDVSFPCSSTPNTRARL